MNFVNKRAGRFVSAVGVLGLVGLAGCAASNYNALSTPPSGTSALTAGGATTIYALQDATGFAATLYQYSASSGNLIPSGSLMPPSGFNFSCVATDSSGKVYVGAYNTTTYVGEILVYAAGATGPAVPQQTLTGTSSGTTTFGIPYSIQVNSAGTLAVLSTNGVGFSIATLPASTPTGTPTPTTLIEGLNTLMYTASSLALDAAGKTYITNETIGQTGQVLVFAAGATGNVAPTSIITPTSTSVIPNGIAVDGSGNIYTDLVNLQGTFAGSLVEYAAGANGAATPIRTISGAATNIFFGLGLRLDSVGNIYAENETILGALDLLAFSPTANGNIQPGLNITSSYLSEPNQDIEIAVH